jgi:hypothetical protein
LEFRGTVRFLILRQLRPHREANRMASGGCNSCLTLSWSEQRRHSKNAKGVACHQQTRDYLRGFGTDYDDIVRRQYLLCSDHVVKHMVLFLVI